MTEKKKDVKRAPTIEEEASELTKKLNWIEKTLKQGVTRDGQKINRVSLLREQKEIEGKLDELKEKIVELRRNRPGGYQIR